jgi:tripartite-type tricarboxylate transporter receptor subunit TctC
VEFPEAPTLVELGYPDSDCPVWFCIYAPAGTPTEIVDKHNAKIIENSKTQDLKDTLQRVAAVPVVQGLDDINRHWENDRKTVAALIKAANVKLE